MDNQIEIRAFTDADREQVLHLFDLNTPAFFGTEEREDLVLYLEQKREDYFVLLVDGQLLGCGGVNYKEKQAWISWDIIDPRYHGQGFGKLLLDFRLQRIRERNQEKTIRVRTSQHAFRFYLKSGFYLTEIREDYWSQGIHLYDMLQHLL